MMLAVLLVGCSFTEKTPLEKYYEHVEVCEICASIPEPGEEPKLCPIGIELMNEMVCTPETCKEIVMERMNARK